MTDSGTAGSMQANYLILDAIAPARQAPPTLPGSAGVPPAPVPLRKRRARRPRSQGRGSSRRFDAACRVTMPYPRKQAEHHDDIASDAAHGQIDAGRAACKPTEHERDHDDVPGRPGAQPSGKIDTVEPSEQPPVPAGTGIGAPQ